MKKQILTLTSISAILMLSANCMAAKVLNFKPLSSEDQSNTSLNISDKSLAINKNPPPLNLALNSSDVIVNMNYDKKKKEYFFQILNKNGFPLSNSDFVPQLSGNIINSYFLKTTLQQVQKENHDLNENQTIFSFKPKDSKGKCEAIYFTYQLKGDSTITTRALLLDKEGESVAKITKDCEVPKVDWRDNLEFTQNNYTAGFNWGSAALSTDKPVKFTTIFTKDGIESIPDDIQAYAISKDFTNLYVMKPQTNKNGAYYGVTFSQNMSYPGTYFFLLTFEGENGKIQTVNAKNTVRAN